MKKLEIKNKITNRLTSVSNDNEVNLIIGNIIIKEARLPHVPDANFM